MGQLSMKINDWNVEAIEGFWNLVYVQPFAQGCQWL
jgi:hypothetical protein